MNKGSAVIELMEKGAADAWREWMQHRANGTVETPEGIAAYERMKLASATAAGERTGRRLLAGDQARAA